MKVIFRLLIFAIPVAAVVGLFLIDPIYGMLAVICALIYFLYTKRGMFVFFAASRSAAKKDYEKAAKRIRYGYDRKWLSPFQELVYAFLVLKRLGDSQSAEDITRKVLENKKLSEQDKGFAQLNLSMVHFFNGDIENAISVASGAYKDYKTTNMYGAYGYYLLAGSDLEKALEINLEAYDFNQDNHVILDNLGQTYIHMGLFDKAGEIYEKLIKLAPTFPEAYYNYALIKEHEGDIDEAIYRMKIALQKEFNFLSTIRAEDIEVHIKRLYEEKDRVKEEADNG